MTDLLIIGAGLSGLLAGVWARRQGLRTRIAATGLGATHWHAGTIDALGYLPGEDAPVRSPFAALTRLTAARPGHPYALTGEAGLREALAAFRALLDELGLPYGGAANPDENLLLPSPAGAPRPVYLAPAAQLAGDMSRPEPYLLVGFQALRDFYPTVIAENLTKLGFRSRAEFLPIELITDRRDFSTIDLARAMDSADLSRLANALKRVAAPGERIGLPAILGLRRHGQIIAALREAVGAPIFEIPTLPPSVPGLRLTTVLREHFERDLHGRLDLGMTVIDFRAEAGRVTWVASRASARPVRHRARRFLLATGGILGGGFHSEPRGRVWETIFDLPLTAPQKRSRWFRPDFLAPEGHPVFRGGVRVGPDFRPLTLAGEPAFENLWAAGNLLADSDPISERSLEGVAIATALAAVTSLIKTDV